MPSPSKQALEDIWRQRVREARLRYEAASAAFRKTWGEHFEQRLSVDPTHAIQQARKVESEALAEYMRALKIFTDLVLHGKIPPDKLAD
jgi:hypothetical protein